MSQELDWELGDIFDGGIFAFPVDDPSAARAVVRYLLMRGVLLEEIAASIEQPGSTSDLAAWLSGDERKSMIGVWATAWLNDARRRHDTDRRRRTVGEFRSSRRQQVVVVVGQDNCCNGANGNDDGNGGGTAGNSGSSKTTAAAGGGWRQASLDSDFGGSEEESYAASGGGASRTNSLEGGLEETSPINGSCSTDDDEIGNSCALQRRRRRRPLSSSADDVTDDRVSGAAMFVTSLPGTSVNAADNGTKYVLLRDHTASRRGGRDVYIQSRADVDSDDSQYLIRPRSEIYESISGCDEFGKRPEMAVGAPLPVVPAELLDSGNVSELACNFDTVEQTILCDDIDDVIDAVNDENSYMSLSDDLLRRSSHSTCGTVLCQCTLLHYTSASTFLDQPCRCDSSSRVPSRADGVITAKQCAELS